MKFFGLELRKASKQETSNIPTWSAGNKVFLTSRSKPMLLSTVYRCVDLISDSVAVLPLETFKIDKDGFKERFVAHPAYDLLNLEPNEDMTRYVFFKTMVASVLLNGNGYAYIERNQISQEVMQLVYIPHDLVGIEWVIDKNGIRRKRYRVAGFKELVEPRDMVHVLNFSYDGIIGVSTLTHARNTIGLSSDSEAHARGFFKGGGNVSGVLAFEGRLSKEQKEQIYETWEQRTNPVTGKPNGIAVLEGNMKYQPISISPKDAQLLESRQFNVVDICRFFSVSPVKAFDLTKSSYSTVEATQLEYLTDTALSVITKTELEINRKVFLPSERKTTKSEFNTAAILRTDKKAQAAYWKDMFYVGGATPNEIRRENNLPRLENGDNAFVQVNVQTLERAVTEPIINKNIKVSDKNLVEE